MLPFGAALCALRRKTLGQFYMENWNKGKAYTFKHVKAMIISNATTYIILRQCDQGIPTSQKPGCGHPARKIPPAMCKRLQAGMREKIGAWHSRAAKKYGKTQQYVSLILKGKSELRYRKRQPAPEVTETQKVHQKTTCTKLRKGFTKPLRKNRDYYGRKTYFSLQNNTCVENKGFYTSDRKNAPIEVRFIKKQKVSKKVLKQLDLTAVQSLMRGLNTKGAARAKWRSRDSYQAVEMRRDKTDYRMRWCHDCYDWPLLKYTR